MLDSFLPFPRLVEVDHIDVAAPPDKAYAAARKAVQVGGDFADGNLALGTYFFRGTVDRQDTPRQRPSRSASAETKIPHWSGKGW